MQGGREELRKRRSDYAKQLNNVRNFHNKDLTLDKFKPGNRQTSSSLIRGGGIKSEISTMTKVSNNPFLDPRHAYYQHKNALWRDHLRESENAASMMRNETLAQDKFTRGGDLTAEEIARGRKERKILAGLKKEKGRIKKLDAEKRVQRLAESKASYAKHQVEAEALRAKKLMGNRLKKAGYTGLGIAGATGLAYGAKKLYDRKKKAEE